MKHKPKYQLRVIALTAIVALSCASFAYLSSLEDTTELYRNNILTEKVEEKKSELLPDVQLIKTIVNKTVEFITFARRL